MEERYNLSRDDETRSMGSHRPSNNGRRRTRDGESSNSHSTFSNSVQACVSEIGKHWLEATRRQRGRGNPAQNTGRDLLDGFLQGISEATRGDRQQRSSRSQNDTLSAFEEDPSLADEGQTRARSRESDNPGGTQARDAPCNSQGPQRRQRGSYQSVGQHPLFQLFLATAEQQFMQILTEHQKATYAQFKELLSRYFESMGRTRGASEANHGGNNNGDDTRMQSFIGQMIAHLLSQGLALDQTMPTQENILHLLDSMLCNLEEYFHEAFLQGFFDLMQRLIQYLEAALLHGVKEAMKLSLSSLLGDNVSASLFGDQLRVLESMTQG